MKNVLLFLFLSLGVQAQQLKIINYNVLHGFENDSTLENKFLGWAKSQDADVFAFQELNGFTADRLEALAEKYGHPYAIINEDVTHPIGITSKYPIVMVQQVTKNTWHSYLYANIKGVHFFVTHLSPFEVKRRRNDLDRILAHTALLPKKEPILVMGDFNALAERDAPNYSDKLLQTMLKSEGRLEPKSGLPIVKGKTIYRNNLNEGKLDFTVTDKMLHAGFKDSYYIKNKIFKHSVPGKSFQTPFSFLRRIDYIWVNGPAAKKTLAADIIHDEVTDNLSDHYPVTLTIKL
jgi:exodeoxyribonuclease-3